jgi:hypothetical protein
MRRLPKSLLLITALACIFALTSIDLWGEAYSVTYHAGWNLVGGSEGTRYAGADGAFYTLQPGDTEYRVSAAGTAAIAGQGYWVYFPVARTVQLPGGSSFTTVELPPGQWVTIGNPSGFRTAPVSGADAVFTWDPGRGYRATRSLLPGQGAWAFSQAGALVTIGLADESAAEDEQRSDEIPSGPVGAIDSSGCRGGDVLAGVYHASRLQVLDSCRTVTGTVVQVRVEADGDFHVNLQPDAGQDGLLNQRNLTIQKGALVVEVIPADQRESPPPLVSDHVAVTGAQVLDRDHGWLEIHPAWRIAPVPR